MRESHRAEAERLLARAVEDEARRAGGGIDTTALLAQARAQFDQLAAAAEEEYAAYTAALDALAASRGPWAGRFGRAGLTTPALVTGAAAIAAACADAAFGTAAGTAVGTGAVVVVAGAA
ncbi:hypothetical protein L1885_15945, partial [Streptomyces fuscigenes]|nr:hypothetical protein [Streptomyces fuscigenes]